LLDDSRPASARRSSGVHTTPWIGTVGAVAGILSLVPSPIWSLHEPAPVEEAVVV